MSMKCENSANSISPYISSIDGSQSSLRPLNPTPKQASSLDIMYQGEELPIKLETIPEISKSIRSEEQGMSYTFYFIVEIIFC